VSLITTAGSSLSLHNLNRANMPMLADSGTMSKVLIRPSLLTFKEQMIMKTVFENTDNSVTVEFESVNCFRETQHLPSGEVVYNELTPFEAAKKQQYLLDQGFSVKEVS